MPLKFHCKPLPPQELKILTHLNSRMNLPEKDKRNLLNLEKGYQGEQLFFHLLEKELTSKCIPLYSLILESNQTEFQIDNLLIYENMIILNEVKNFEGDFFIKDDKWYAVFSRKEIRNPILQLQRSEYLLRQLLQKIGVHFQIKSYVVFVNPEFTLYQAPYDKSLIFPTQLNRYVQKLNSFPSNLTMRHTKLASDLIARHLPESPRQRLPKYNHDQLKKGIVCQGCKRFMMQLNRAKLRCPGCATEEKIEKAVIRKVAEFNLLFPERRITTTEIYQWCKVISSKKMIRRILMENMTIAGKGRNLYFIFKK